MSRDIDADRLKRVIGGNPSLAGRTLADVVRFVFVEVQPQLDQHERNTDDWAPSIQNGVFDVVTGKK